MLGSSIKKTFIATVLMQAAVKATEQCVPGEEGCHEETEDMQVSMLQYQRSNETAHDIVAQERQSKTKTAVQSNESQEESLDGALSRKGGGGHGGHRHNPHHHNPHHHAPPPTPPHTPEGDWYKQYEGKKEMTVYHQTSEKICKLIQASNFKIGKGGWCGKAVYFAMDPLATTTKAITAGSNEGCMLEAKVDVGNILFSTPHGECSPPGSKWNWMTEGWKGPEEGLPPHLKEKGDYQSVIFHLNDGDELIIYDPAQIKSITILPFKSEWKVKDDWKRRYR
jgi:hypothetical protein